MFLVSVPIDTSSQLLIRYGFRNKKGAERILAFSKSVWHRVAQISEMPAL